MKQGVLLVNLGSPESPSVPDVRRYLREFLMDGRVLDVNWILRFCIVHFGVLPSRPAQSSEAYRKIWTPAGSPLIVTSRKVQVLLQARVPIPVGLAMRYQTPSIPAALKELEAKGVNELLLIPLFPHYAMSSYETAVVRVQKVAASIAPGMRIHVEAPFYDVAGYVRALVGSASEYLQKEFDCLLFSFHGIPERHIRKSDPTDCHCLENAECCRSPNPAEATCYRVQCFHTVDAVVNAFGLPKANYAVAFQSRLGREAWLKPYTDQELRRLAEKGVKKLLVICPAFVSDCLETLEEIGIRGRQTFLAAGGAEFTLIPCLNEHPLWIEALEGMVRRFLATSRPAQTKGKVPVEPV